MMHKCEDKCKCTGYKYPETCPYGGVFQGGDNPTCRECVVDAQSAVKEMNADIYRQEALEMVKEARALLDHRRAYHNKGPYQGWIVTNNEIIKITNALMAAERVLK